MFKACTGATDAVVDTDLEKKDEQKGQPVYDEAWANDIYANKDMWPMVIFDMKPDVPTPVSGSYDHFLDLILEELNKKIPAKEDLPNEEVNFHGVDAKVYNGYIKGLNTFRRDGNAGYSIKGETVDIEAGIKLGPLYGHYDGEVKFHFLKVHPSVTISVNDVDLKIKISGTVGKTGQIQEFKFQAGVPVIHISGLGPLGKILDKLLNFLGGKVSSWINSFVGGLVKKIIQKILDEFPLKPPHKP